LENADRIKIKTKNMAKYSKKAQDKIEKVMHEFKEGTLKSGKNGSGGKVKSRKQAIAIGISEAREAGLKVPPEKKEE
jgi:hypothetical protein